MWRRWRNDPRVNEELQYHRECLVDRHMAAGLSRSDAERRAALEFGNASVLREAVHDVRGRRFADLGQDLRYSVRTVRRNPGFALLAVLSLALGIGANTAIFSVVNAVMLRPLPVRQPDELVQIARVRQDPGQQQRPGLLPYPAFEHLRDRLTTVSATFAQMTTSVSLLVHGDDDLVAADLVSGSYFDVLGVRPAAGRVLGPADDAVSPPALSTVITDQYWQRRFARSADAIGTSIVVRDRVCTIVGVTERGFRGAQSGRSTDVVLPLQPFLTAEQRQNLGFNSLAVLGRLRAGTSSSVADAEIRTVFAAFLQARTAELPERQRAEILRQRAGAFPAAGGFNPLRSDVGRPLLILMGVVALVLLLACVNLSGLLLARALARRREVAIRLAMGAGRGRLIRQSLTETLVLAAMGGLIGLAFARPFSTWLVAVFGDGRDLALSVEPDWRVFGFTAVVSLAACAAAGLAPALRATSVPLQSALKEARLPGHGRFGRVLVAAQVALSMVLVVGATLFVGTLVNLRAVDPGFERDGLLVVNVRSSRRFDAMQAGAVQRSLLERMRSLPGVEAASAAQALPVGGGLWDRRVQVEGYPAPPDEPNVGFNVIAPGYFSTLGTPLRAGREFTAADTGTAPKVAIVNERFARHFFGSNSPIGRRVSSVGVAYEIVGVVADAKYQDLREEILQTMYIPWTQRDAEQPSTYSYLVRMGAGHRAALLPALDRLVRDVDPALRVRTTIDYATIVSRSIAIERLMATLAGLVGGLALLIAALGIFGVLAFQVMRRTNEIGVRMALGASQGSVARLVLRDLATFLVPGIAVGTVVALVLAGLARGLVFGVTPTDPAVFAVAAFVLSTAAVAASTIPALRAVRLDPSVALRRE